MGKGFTNTSNERQASLWICPSNLFSVHKKHRRFAILPASTAATADLMRDGLYCNNNPLSKFFIFTVFKPSKRAATSSQHSSCFLCNSESPRLQGPAYFPAKRTRSEQSKLINSEKLKQIKDIVPELKERQIRMDSVTFSKEGMAALREKVQSMPGHIDVREMMELEEIMPKLRTNPSDDFLWAMRSDIQNSLNTIKQSNGSYTFDDLISIRMEAYAKQYDGLQKSYANGSRDIYVSDGIDENGKWQYHKVTQEEDLTYLNKAFQRIADGMAFSAESQELSWQIKEKFGGEKALSVSLPEGYGERLSGILQRAAATYAEEKSKRNDVDATDLALKYLNEDKKFVDAMRKLFSNIQPMP